MAFHNVLMPVEISEGAVGGPMFHTTVVATSSGYEQRNADWDLALLSWEIDPLMWEKARLDTLIAFFRARQGRAHSFLFRDPSDYYIGMAFTGNNLLHTGTHNFDVGNGVKTVFPIYRVYDSGGFNERRRISRPVSTIKVYLNGTEQSTGFTVDYNVGTITFSTPPANGVNVGWSGQFYVPARFNIDDLKLNLVSNDQTQARVPIVEVREDVVM